MRNKRVNVYYNIYQIHIYVYIYIERERLKGKLIIKVNCHQNFRGDQIPWPIPWVCARRSVKIQWYLRKLELRKN